MNLRTAIIAGGVAALTLGAVAVTSLSTPVSALADEASKAGVTKVSFFHGGHHGWHRGSGPMCGPMRGERVEKMINFVESFMDFTPPQQAAWGKLTTALRDADKGLDTACQAAAKQQQPATAPEHLARMESFMTAGLDAIHKVRPAFDDFYGTLNDKQQKALDQMLQHGGHRWHHEDRKQDD
ncbi:MAG TPA: Spy/CpxP family protein refolding chaperone [Alphaproteobacteria bacterium]|nr:Spy/CpxP family protein refolding chaperone [Alphaproteobacteria bacterium]